MPALSLSKALPLKNPPPHSDTNSMDCADVKPKMEALASGTLPAPEREVAEQHIASCEGCRLELELVRAIGSQEGSAETSQADWSLDRIFNAGGADAPEATPPPPDPSLESAAEPSPPDDAEAFFFGTEALAEQKKTGASERRPHAADENQAKRPAPDEPKSPPPAGKPEESKGPETWAFEPVDGKREVSPPAKSLFFAEEALTRRKDIDRKKSSTLRLILGVTGGLAGAVLLAVSAWIALHMAQRSADSDDLAARQRLLLQGAPAATEPADSTSPDASAATAGVTDAGAAAVGGADAGAGDAPSGPSAPPPDQQTSSDEGAPISASSSGQPSPLPTTGTIPNPASLTRAPVAAEATPEATVPAPAPKRSASLAPSRSSASAGAGASRRKGTSQTAARPGVPKPADEPTGTKSSAQAKPPARPTSQPIVEDRAPPVDAFQPVDSPEPAPRTTEEPAPVPARSAPTRTSQPASDATARSSDATSVVPGPSATHRSSPPASLLGREPRDVAPETAVAPSTEVVTPVQRLHLATAAAEERGDLVALRQLRVSWKGLMSKMGVGPDRARAKREYADCLWAIQSLTGRRIDQKAALTAYREYILSAPAGGSDSRSVSRLRQLEDALSERQ